MAVPTTGTGCSTSLSAAGLVMALVLAPLATAAAILLADQNVDASEAAWMVRAAQALDVTIEEAVAILRETQRQARAARG